MDRFKRFLRQLAWVVGVLAGLLLLAWFLSALYFGYWLPDPKGATMDERAIAVFEALGMPAYSPDAYQSCDGENYSATNRSCFTLEMSPKRHCRWWLLEKCNVYAISDLALRDPETLGRVIDAAINPCSYLMKSKEPSLSMIQKECVDRKLDLTEPVIIIFRGKNHESLMRID